MQAIKFRYETEHKFQSPISEVVEFFRDLENLAYCTADLESFRLIDEHTAHWTLKTKREMGLVLQPIYQLVYEWESPKTLCWKTVGCADGNTEINARLQFTAASATTTRVSISEAVEFMLPVSMITAKIVRVIASRETVADTQKFLRRMDERLMDARTVERRG